MTDLNTIKNNGYEYSVIGDLENAEKIFVHVCGDNGMESTETNAGQYVINNWIQECKTDSSVAYVIIDTGYKSSSSPSTTVQKAAGANFGDFLINNIIRKNSNGQIYSFNFHSSAGEYGFLGLAQAIKKIPEGTTIGVNMYDADAVTSLLGDEGRKIFNDRNVLITVFNAISNSGNVTEQGSRLNTMFNSTYNGFNNVQRMYLNSSYLPNNNIISGIEHGNVQWAAYIAQFPQLLAGTIDEKTYQSIINTKIDLKSLALITLASALGGSTVTNNRKLINDFVSSMQSNLSRLSDSIKHVTIENDITGIGDFINGKVDAYNELTTKLYTNLEQEAKAIKSYSNYINDLDEYLAAALAAATGSSVSSSNKSSSNAAPNGNSSNSSSSNSSKKPSPSPSPSPNPTPNSEPSSEPSNGTDPPLLDVDPKDIDANYLLNKDITQRAYDLTAEDLDRLFAHWAEVTGDPNSPAIGQGAAFIEASRESGIDPLVLVGICGKETGRAKSTNGGWINNNNFFGLKYIKLNGQSMKFAGENHLFDTPREGIIESAKHIKSFYYDQHGGHTVAGLAATGYNGGVNKEKYGQDIAYIMKESLDYIISTKK